MAISLPHNYVPRPYQLSILRALDSGTKRAVWCLHRRAGKDLTLWNWLINTLVQQRQSAFYILPTYAQAKKIIWEGMTKAGIRFLDCIPRQLIAKKSESELSIRFTNGAYLQLVGSENYDRLVGTNPQICIFSEMALQNPLAWDFIRPILAENNGTAVFISTPRGKNHFHDLFEMAKSSSDWFCEQLTIEDTQAISKGAIEQERASGMSEEMIQQEFYVSFDIGVQGAYYTQSLAKCKKEDRITYLPYDDNLLVYTAWDLGISDSMSIIFYQLKGKEIRIIDAYENHGYALSHYINIMRSKPYAYGVNYFPHDGANRNLSDGKRLVSVANESEYSFEIVDSRISVIEGIEKVRGKFTRFFFDKTKCGYLLKCLEQYHAEYNDKARVYMARPAHEWSSHMSDALRIMAIAIDTRHDGKHCTEDDIERMEAVYRPKLAIRGSY